MKPYDRPSPWSYLFPNRTCSRHVLLVLFVVSSFGLSCSFFQNSNPNNNRWIPNNNQRRNERKRNKKWLLAVPNTALATTSAMHPPTMKLYAVIPSGGGDEELGLSSETEEDSSGSLIAKGRFLLLLVSFLYGTLNVSLRLVYNLPDPPIASALSTTRGWLATGCFVPLLLFNEKQQPDEERKEKSLLEETNKPSSTTTAATLSSALVLAATELAFWNFCSQGLINYGLMFVGSARAAFLTQTSVVITPILSFVTGQTIKPTVWIGCVIAFLGLIVLSGGAADVGEVSAAATATAEATTTLVSTLVHGLTGFIDAFSFGDCIVLGGTVCWSMYLFRLSKIAPKFSSQEEIPLQGLKTAILALLYTGWLGVSVISSSDTLSIWGGWNNPLAWMILLYSALGPGTIADVLQQQGQKYVNASETNIILSLEPIFAAVCAFFLLGETMSLQESIGGGLIIFAAFLSTKQ